MTYSGCACSPALWTSSGAKARNPAPTPPRLVPPCGAGNCGAADPPGGSAFYSVLPSSGADDAPAVARMAAGATFAAARYPDLVAYALAIAARRIKAKAPTR